ncbi:MAG: hypothetical protein AVDCRST_MAG18-3664 [uncultured Thermomicrobiales bacterium]|uniref:Uncharacterized protein n=1 Tax=uncultured Thermomicrobiales bacterium TaxID=1645740 RepID=A0A6J4VNY4_9BACT|nr:MAG: hypothetical protein AVDCRST_MAG18-3664 [uncultured Thermomicrobiales bacterium]
MVVLFRQRAGNDIVEGRRVGTPLFGPPGDRYHTDTVSIRPPRGGATRIRRPIAA